ncbi:MAG: DUF1573 domain-containing protein [Bacteroidales bacterium]|nr:DUF1573 domain-containing protein [Bacteroidales bacterium]
MNKFICVFFGLLLFSVHLKSQNDEFLKFDITEHDFGLVKEELGTVSCTFEYTNMYNKPVTIQRVVAGCGCTASEYTQTPVRPGRKGTVKVTYNANNRPGRISQVVTIITDIEENPNFTVAIKGEVIPREPSKLDLYPIAMGNLRLKSSHLAFEDIKNTQSKTLSLELYNNWTQTMTLSIASISDFITYRFEPEQLRPEEEGRLIITYHADKKNDYGLIFDQLHLATNDADGPDKYFYISANIMEDFSYMSLNELRNAPNMEFEELAFDFDTISEGEKVTHKFTFINNGLSDLRLRKIATSCGCTASEVSSDIIRPGESAWIIVDFDSHGKRGQQRQTITIINNNPHDPVIQLVMHGFVNSR